MSIPDHVIAHVVLRVTKPTPWTEGDKKAFVASAAVITSALEAEVKASVTSECRCVFPSLHEAAYEAPHPFLLEKAATWTWENAAAKRVAVLSPKVAARIFDFTCAVVGAPCCPTSEWKQAKNGAALAEALSDVATLVVLRLAGIRATGCRAIVDIKHVGVTRSAAPRTAGQAATTELGGSTTGASDDAPPAPQLTPEQRADASKMLSKVSAAFRHRFADGLGAALKSEVASSVPPTTA